MDAECLARKRWKPAEKALAKREQIARKLVEARARVGELSAAHPTAVEQDRQARGYALAEGTPAPSSKAEKIAGELAQAQELVKDLDAASVHVEAQLQEVLEANRDSWSQAQERAIEQAGEKVLSSLASLEQTIATLEQERSLLAWILPAPSKVP